MEPQSSTHSLSFSDLFSEHNSSCIVIMSSIQFSAVLIIFNNIGLMDVENTIYFPFAVLKTRKKRKRHPNMGLLLDESQLLPNLRSATFH